MAVDVRGYTVAIGPSGTLGRVVSGAVSDSYISGGIGLVKTSGHVVVQGFITPRAGTPVTLRATMPAGNVYQVPRFMRVLSSCIVPQDRTTRIELGCRLKYFEDFSENLVYTQTQGLQPPEDVTPSDNPFTGRVLATSIMAVCASKIGLSLSGSVSMGFAGETFDLSTGYVSIMDGLLASAGMLGYLSDDDTLGVIDLASVPTSARSLGEGRIISVSPLGIGQLPADSVSVTHKGLKLKAADGTEQTQTDWESGWNETFARSATSSLSTIVVPYQDPGTGEQATAVFDVRDVTEEESSYDRVNGNNVLAKRVQQETKSSVAVAGAVVTDYLSAGVPWGSGSVTSTTTETFSYDSNGREVERRLVRKGDRLYGLGSVGLPMSFPSADPESPTGIDLVPVPTGQMILEETVVRTYRTNRFQKTITRRYGPWIQTPMGQQTIAESREYFDTAQKVVDFMAVALDGSFLLDVSISSQKATDTEEAAPNVWEYSLPNMVADEADGDEGFAVEETSTAVYAIGTGSYGFSSYSYSAPDLGGMTAAEISQLAAAVSAGAVPQRGITLSMPYNDEDRVYQVGTSPVTYRVQKGQGEAQARRYGRIYNDLLIGVRYGLSLQTAARSLPAVPFSPIAVTIAGTSGVFRSNAASWTISSDGIIGSMDALFAGGIGGPSYAFPIAQGVTAPTTLPTETTNEPAQVVGTVADVGGDPDATLDAAFPSAVTGDGAQDLTTLAYWVFNGTTWDNVGTDPGATVTVTPLPVVTESSVGKYRTRHRLTVQAFDYALSLPVVDVAVRSRSRVVVTNP